VVRKGNKVAEYLDGGEVVSSVFRTPQELASLADQGRLKKVTRYRTGGKR